LYYVDPQLCSELFEVSEHDKEFLQQGVVSSTRGSYKSNIKQWVRFKEKFGYDTNMELEQLSTDKQRIVLIKFIRYLYELKNPSTVIGSVLASVQYYMKVKCADVKIFTDSSIQLARRAALPSQRSESLRKEQTARYPVTLDMLVWLRDGYFVSGSVDDKMTYLGCILGFTFIWRISQYVSDGKSEHAILADDVRFKLVTGEIKRPWELHSVNETSVECVIFIVRSNKQRGNETQHLYLGRKSEKESQLLNNLVSWSHISGIKEGDPFMSRYIVKGRRQSHKKLTRRMVSTALKVVATAFGFDAVHFAPHGLRIGAATAGKAKGGREFVQETAGWDKDSDNDLRYEHGSPLDDNALSISRTCFSILTAEQVKTMMSVTAQPTQSINTLPVRRRSALGKTLVVK